MSEVSPEDYLTNFRTGCESGTVPVWFAMEILLRKTALWGPRIVLAHSQPEMVEELRRLAAAIASGQQNEDVASWRDVDDDEVRARLRLLAEYVSAS